MAPPTCRCRISRPGSSPSARSRTTCGCCTSRRRAPTGCAFFPANRCRASRPARVEGPGGEFLLNEESHRPLIFIACETGFAPIKSLIEHAMALDAAETLHLYWIPSRKGPDRHRLGPQYAGAAVSVLDRLRQGPLPRQSLPLLERRPGQLPLRPIDGGRRLAGRSRHAKRTAAGAAGSSPTGRFL